jgi:hypothetical protein|tara:strand:- start:549 stop:764 length:216 start_codon:yes stop_codon:yes gene_type:complete
MWANRGLTITLNRDILYTMTSKNEKIKKLENLAKACADAKDDEMKKMWFDKLIDLAKQYDMRDFVMNKLVH